MYVRRRKGGAADDGEGSFGRGLLVQATAAAAGARRCSRGCGGAAARDVGVGTNVLCV